MSNHGYVKTRKFMSKKKIDQLLIDVNKRVFHNNLRIDYHEGKPGTGWGPHVWQIGYYSGGTKYAQRICWLNTRRSWEISHGGSGGDFTWWLDSVLTNEVAVQFDGNITDEGIPDRWKGESNKHDNCIGFLRMMREHIKDKKLQLALLQLEMELVPPEFQVDLGPKIELVFEEASDARMDL